MTQPAPATKPICSNLPKDTEGFDSLAELALDMRWSWNHATDEVWRKLDPTLWELTQNPWVVLQTVSRHKLEQLLADPAFRKNIADLLQAKRQAAEAPAWFQGHDPQGSLSCIAYFSMEFMLSEALPIYSGGLGNVAGDQLKAASDLGVPVVGVGLLYQQGYFRQVIDQDGAQQALFPYNDPGQLPIMPLRQPDGEWLRLEVALPGYSVYLRAWQVQVGRVKLYLLDSNDAANFPAHRGITSDLYGSGPELSLKQELILGLGGWRLLDALGIHPEVCHLNEGHAAFAVLERARDFMKETGQSFEVALAVTRAGNLFTTHTAVAAGFDRFAPALIERYLGGYAEERLGIKIQELLALGRQNPNDSSESFNMAYLAIRGSGAVNGVSRLHGKVSRHLFEPLFPQWPAEEVPVGYVTNGVHMPTWDSPAADELWTKACGKGRWLGTSEKLEQDIRRVSDASLWQFRMGIHQIGKIGDYVRYLQENPQELDLLFKELLIGVTSFFRDPAVWEELRVKILPALIASRSDGHVLRAWVPGCSTGEEAYSLAMVFKEVMEKVKAGKKMKLQVFATDLDKDAIDKARQGVYPENIAADVAPKQMSRFFTKDEHGCRVTAEIRGLVTFAPQSVIQDPPFTKLDILSCRNLLIYLAPEVQKKLIPLFHYTLTPGGLLILGSAETVGTFTNLFTPLNHKLRIFQRTESLAPLEPIEFPSSFAPPLPDGIEPRPAPKPPQSLQSLADQLILEHYAPPAVLVNEKGDILYVSGRTGKYLEPASGKANWNIFAMAREGLRYEMSNAFHKALEQPAAVVVRGLKVETNGGPQYVDITAQRLEQPAPLRSLMLIVFADAPAPLETKLSGRPGKPAKAPAHNRQLEELERKFQQARQEAQTVREEMQTSQEELRSTNEEQQSTNEELQSTNEELTTSKEEMQSLNEELQTVNAELQAKVDELSRSNNDMKNLLNSTDIATLFLDVNLNVRRFTTQATKIIKLIPGDVGRPITDLASDLLYPELTTDAQEVLRKLGFVEKPVNTRDGRWFTMRIMPYRTLDDRIDGVVITLADITVAKTLEAQLREQHAVLEKHLAEQSQTEEAPKDKAPVKTAGSKRSADAAGKLPAPNQV